MYASRSYLPNGAMKVEILGPVYGWMTVPLRKPFVVLGDGEGSYCLFRSQYCVYEPSVAHTISHELKAASTSLQPVPLTAEVGPQAMNRPAGIGKQLSLAFIARVCIPELCLHEQSTICLYAAGIDRCWIRFGRAGEDVGRKHTSVIEITFAVQRGGCWRKNGRRSNEVIGRLHL